MFKTPNTQMLKILKHISNNIKLEDTFSNITTFVSDILIYSNERHVMLVDFSENNEITAENVIFIGLLCRNGQWFAIVYEIGFGRTRELSILNIVDISYSFEKIQTYDITIHNYKEFLQPKTMNKVSIEEIFVYSHFHSQILNAYIPNILNPL